MLHLYPAKYIFRAISFLLLTTIFLSNCKKNTDSVTAGETNPDFNTKVTAALVSGFVTDENDAPVENAAVVIGSKIIATDKYGYFEASNASVVKMAATVTVNKTGYFKAIKTFTAAEGKGAFFRIKLLPKKTIGLFNAVSGGTISMPGGFVIKFPAAAITDVSTNKPFTGDVIVTAAIINATDPDLNRIMPGDLRGVNSNNTMQLLTTYGMVAVELNGTGGEFLQITMGKKAAINMPIPAALLASAPATIPLWYFDEDKGLWIEEGSATKSGNVYVGEVSHFSFWNWDVPQSLVLFNATIVDSANKPVINAVVKISVAGNSANYRYGYTDHAGYVSGAVPAKEPLLFEVYSSLNCGTILYSKNISASEENFSLGTVTVAGSNNIAAISGKVLGCTNAPVSNGYIMVINGTICTRLNLSDTGTYAGNILVCANTGSSVTLVAEDIITHMASSPLVRTIIPGSNTIPTIQTCSVSQQEYVTITKNGVTQTYRYLLLTNATSTSYGIVYFLDPAMAIPGGHLQISKTGIAAGSIQDLISISTGATNMIINNPPVNIPITEYGAIGQYIAGSFTGSFTQPPQNTLNAITCSFRIKRTF